MIKKIISNAILSGSSQILLLALLLLLNRYEYIKETAEYAMYLSWMSVATILLTLREEVFYIYSPAKVNIIENNIIKRAVCGVIAGILFLLIAHERFFAIIGWSIIGASFNAIIMLTIQKFVNEQNDYKVILFRYSPVFVFLTYIAIIYYIIGVKFEFLILADIASKITVLIIVKAKTNYHVKGKIVNNINIYEVSISTFSAMIYGLPFMILPFWTSPEIIAKIYIGFKLANAPVTLISTGMNDLLKMDLKRIELKAMLSVWYKDILKKISLLSLFVSLSIALIFILLNSYIIDLKIDVLIIAIFLLPAMLRFISASLAFIPQMTFRSKSTFFVYLFSLLFLIAFSITSIFYESMLYKALLLAAGFIVLPIFSILQNSWIISKCN